jgi:hypothetical protein
MRAGMRAVVKTVGAPKLRVLPYRLGPTLDQGDYPACTGTGFRHLVNAAPVMMDPKKGVTWLQFYYGAQENDEWEGNDYEGSSVRGVFKFAQQQGYLKSYVFADTMDVARKFIRDGYGTIEAGTNWYAEMSRPVNGVIPTIRSRTPIGGHAYHLAWTFLKGDKPIKMPKSMAGLDLSLYDVIQQSWGDNANWPGAFTFMGQQGCALILKTLMNRLFREEGEMGAGIQAVVK